MKLWKTFRDDSDREKIISRIRILRPESPARWGKMNAPRMMAHLTDQMQHCLGDVPARKQNGLISTTPVRLASIYIVPWPRGRVQGPPEAYVTRPSEWESDRDRLIGLVNRFATCSPQAKWAGHALLGRMSGRDRGVFCHKHINHHLTQFGA